MFKKYPLAIRAISFLLFPLCLIVWFLHQHYVVDALPQKNGVKIVEGINASVEITRDKHGVVIINAKNDNDVYFAMGYIHAQDRLWQLELQRRLSQGRLSEIFGRGTVEQDIWIRTLGIHRAAKNSLEYLSDEAISSLDAYTAGINSWINNSAQLPLEFSLLNIKPEPWSNEDTLSWVKMFALSLASSYSHEIQRFIGTQYLTQKQLHTFFPELATEKNELSQKMKYSEKVNQAFFAFNNIQENLEQEYQIGGRFVGSNAWVVSGELTSTGLPILANDPHLGLQIPSLWYAVKQKGVKLDASGMSLVGIPLIVFGKNKHISWGGTNMMADVQDLYFEQLNANNPNQYYSSGKWTDFLTHKEVIEVKADFPAALRAPLKPIEIKVRESIHGPIISDAVKGFEQPVAMRWTALDKGDTTYESFFRLSYASNWKEFNEALSFHVAPTLNILYADSNNNIGSLGVGKVPIRNVENGALPVFGNEKKYDWLGYIAFDEMPKKYNPKEGYIVNANNKNHNKGYPYFISFDFAPEERASRITQMLDSIISSGNKIDVNHMQKIQADVKDLSVTNLLDTLSKVKGNSLEQEEAVATLKSWNGIADRESIGATIYYGWLRHLKSRLFSDELKAYWQQDAQVRYLRSIQTMVSADKIHQLLETDSVWCDNILSEQIETCSNILVSALHDTVEEMVKFLGRDISSWQWGNAQKTLYEHTPFSKVKILDEVFERRVGNGGSVNTINVASSGFWENEGYLQRFGAGFRQIMELGGRHLYMNSTGQSGQVASPNYDNMIESFSNVEYYDFPQENSSVNKLVLQTKK